jgi:hypothetical protein
LGALVVVIPHPERKPLAGILEACELSPLKELLQGRVPEPLDPAKRHGMMGAGFDVKNPVL